MSKHVDTAPVVCYTLVTMKNTKSTKAAAPVPVKSINLDKVSIGEFCDMIDAGDDWVPWIMASLNAAVQRAADQRIAGYQRIAGSKSSKNS